MNRRSFALGAGSTLLLASCGRGPGSVVETGHVVVPAPDGTLAGSFVHPDGGVWPGVVLWSDTGAVARELASEGFAVLTIERAGIGRRTPAIRLRDAAAAAGWLDAQPQTDRTHALSAVGTRGGAQAAVETAAAVPDRVRKVVVLDANGSVGNLPPDLLRRTRATFLFVHASSEQDEALRSTSRGEGGRCLSSDPAPRPRRPSSGSARSSNANRKPGGDRPL